MYTKKVKYSKVIRANTQYFRARSDKDYFIRTEEIQKAAEIGILSDPPLAAIDILNARGLYVRCGDSIINICAILEKAAAQDADYRKRAADCLKVGIILFSKDIVEKFRATADNDYNQVYIEDRSQSAELFIIYTYEGAEYTESKKVREFVIDDISAHTYKNKVHIGKAGSAEIAAEDFPQMPHIRLFFLPPLVNILSGENIFSHLKSTNIKYSCFKNEQYLFAAEMMLLSDGGYYVDVFHMPPPKAAENEKRSAEVINIDISFATEAEKIGVIAELRGIF